MKAEKIVTRHDYRLALLPYMPENKTEKLMAVKRPDGSYYYTAGWDLVNYSPPAPSA